MRLLKLVLPHALISSFLLATVFNVALGDEGSPVPPKYTGVFIENINYEGSGCPAGTVESQITSDHRITNLLFNSFGLQVNGSLTGELNTNCDIQITVDVPPEYAVAISTVNLGGFMVLPKGAGGSLESRFFMAGQEYTSGIHQTWFNDEEDWLFESFYLSSGINNNRLNDESLHERSIAEENLVFSGCGENAVIDIKTNIKRFSNEGVMLGTVQVNSMTSVLAIEYEWRDCSM